MGQPSDPRVSSGSTSDAAGERADAGSPTCPAADALPPADGVPATTVPPARRGFRAGDAVILTLAYVGAQVATGILVGVWVGLAYVLRGGDPEDAEALAELGTRVEGAGGVLGAAVGGLVIVAMLLRRVRAEPAVRAQLGLFAGSRAAVGVALAAGAALAALYLGAVSLGLAFGSAPPVVEPGPVTRMGLTPGWQRDLWAVSALFLFPVIEELVFRGALYGGLRRTFGIAPAAVATTLLFVALHAAEFQSYLPAAVALTALGAAAIVARERSGALGPAVALHTGYNAVIVVATRLLETPIQ